MIFVISPDFPVYQQESSGQKHICGGQSIVQP